MTNSPPINQFLKGLEALLAEHPGVEIHGFGHIAFSDKDHTLVTSGRYLKPSDIQRFMRELGDK